MSLFFRVSGSGYIQADCISVYRYSDQSVRYAELVNADSVYSFECLVAARAKQITELSVVTEIKVAVTYILLYSDV